MAYHRNVIIQFESDDIEFDELKVNSVGKFALEYAGGEVVVAGSTTFGGGVRPGKEHNVKPGSIFTVCNCLPHESGSGCANVTDFNRFRGYLHFEGPRFMQSAGVANNVSFGKYMNWNGTTFPGLNNSAVLDNLLKHQQGVEASINMQTSSHYDAYANTLFNIRGGDIRTSLSEWFGETYYGDTVDALNSNTVDDLGSAFVQKMKDTPWLSNNAFIGTMYNDGQFNHGEPFTTYLNLTEARGNNVFKLDDLALEGTNLIEGSFHVVNRYSNIDFMDGDDNDNFQTASNRQYALKSLVAGAEGVQNEIGPERLCPSYAANMTAYYTAGAVVSRHNERVGHMFTGADVLKQCGVGSFDTAGANNLTDALIWDPFNEYWLEPSNGNNVTRGEGADNRLNSVKSLYPEDLSESTSRYGDLYLAHANATVHSSNESYFLPADIKAGEYALCVSGQSGLNYVARYLKVAGVNNARIHQSPGGWDWKPRIHEKFRLEVRVDAKSEIVDLGGKLARFMQLLSKFRCIWSTCFIGGARSRFTIYCYISIDCLPLVEVPHDRLSALS